ncbi:MAG: DUF4178 domain-containing protein [Calditrichaeota bacterium]|nr:DUF4178 domain-containing protein [Calditrichota bacterium]
MSLFDIFKGKAENEELDPLADLTLSRLKVGYYLDFDLKTWEVTAYNRYDYGEGDYGDEWELTSGREKIYLERGEDDEVEWSVSKKLPIGAIEGNIPRHIIEFEDPPNQIEAKGKTYYLDESGSAYFYKGGRGQRIGFIAWDFIDEEGENFVTIEQWGEEAFEAAEGRYVEEYEFTNILPGLNS